MSTSDLVCAQCGHRVRPDGPFPDVCPNCLNAGTLGEVTPAPSPHASAANGPTSPLGVSRAPLADGITGGDGRGAPRSMTFTYLVTGQSVTVPFENPLVLGRHHAGRALFDGQVPQVSRRHCQIRWDGQDLFIVDLGSMHGTAAGPERVDCRAPRRLRGGDTIYLGREPVRVDIELASAPTLPITHVAQSSSQPAAPPSPVVPEIQDKSGRSPSSPAPEAGRPVGSHCAFCGHRDDEPFEVCPSCGAMN